MADMQSNHALQKNDFFTHFNMDHISTAYQFNPQWIMMAKHRDSIARWMIHNSLFKHHKNIFFSWFFIFQESWCSICIECCPNKTVDKIRQHNHVSFDKYLWWQTQIKKPCYQNRNESLKMSCSRGCFWLLWSTTKCIFNFMEQK